MSNPSQIDLLRQLPAVQEFLKSAAGNALCREFGTGMVKLAVRDTLNLWRDRIQAGQMTLEPSFETLSAATREALVRVVVPQGRHVLNATGILLHTHLGRAPLCSEAVEAIGTASRYTPLEVNLESGHRGQRGGMAERLLRELTGCEAALVVNNNAAATALVLNTLAPDAEVILSRGQLIEIGGSFRLPDVIRRSQARLREVGTTNRTHLNDYRDAITDQTAALFFAHPSNYRIQGFTSTPPLSDLVQLAHAHGLPLIADLGSGALVPMEEFGFSDEPVASNAIGQGADILCFSGDKLIGGPQCGIVCGRSAYIEPMRKNPLLRMLRVDKLTLAALEATLTHFVNGTFREKLPLYEMLTRSEATLESMAAAVRERIAGGSTKVEVTVVQDVAYVGSGSIPEESLPTYAVRITRAPNEPEAPRIESLARALRLATPSVFGRVQQGALLLDMRTLLAGEEARLADICLSKLGS